MAITTKLSSSYGAVRKRISRIPDLFLATVFTSSKRDAIAMINNFHSGIKSNNFGLEKLADGTIQRKATQGMERPQVPLYGKGDDKKDNSYINGLRLKKIKNGYRVYFSKGKHWSGNLSLEDLYFIHENGAVIKRGDALILIPPRQAFSKAFARTIKQRRNKETSAKVRAAYAEYLRTGSKERINTLNRFLERVEEAEAEIIEE